MWRPANVILINADNGFTWHSDIQMLVASVVVVSQDIKKAVSGIPNGGGGTWGSRFLRKGEEL